MRFNGLQFRNGFVAENRHDQEVASGMNGFCMSKKYEVYVKPLNKPHHKPYYGFGVLEKLLS